jgi:Ferric uptake regulator family
MPLPQTEMPGRLQAHFSERGIRMTQQRRAILSVMETASKHLDATQILRKAQRLDAGVDRSTVYRTLQLLKRHGLIDELDLMHINGEGHYYERKMGPRPHPHGVPALRKNLGVRQRGIRETQGASRERLPLSRGGFAAGDRRLLLRVQRSQIGDSENNNNSIPQRE